ncbi:MAG TPA: hypothetical protein VKV80_12225 [Streptosporangiaceae bacterium]|nr:hypothetical protein [Streptosporangiaceae bacterium]
MVAASCADPLLCSLDAIHLATAQVLAAELGEPLAAFVTYGTRPRAAVQAAGFATVSGA